MTETKIGAVIFAMSMMLCTGCSQQTADGYLLKHADLPEQAVYPKEDEYVKDNGDFDYDTYDTDLENWMECSSLKREKMQVYEGKLNTYLSSSVSALMSHTEGENRVCSPVNIFFALGMMAEITDGSTRQEILGALGFDALEELRSCAQALFEADYNDDGLLTQIPGASLWLNDDLSFNEDTLNSLALYYYVSVYHGDVNDEGFTEAFRQWLNEMTNGLLEDSVNELEPFTEDSVLTLASSVYFSGSWTDSFAYEGTYTEVFNGTQGEEETEFMHRCTGGKAVILDDCMYTDLSFNGGSCLRIILPDEDTDAETLLSSGIFEKVLNNDDAGAEYMINLSLPKFDLQSELDLIPVMQEMGIQQVFTSDADFSSLTDNADVSLTSAKHNARLKVDEDGCEAAAYTVMMVGTTALLPEGDQLDFNCSRPFLFALISADGLPLFTGIVNQIG